MSYSEWERRERRRLRLRALGAWVGLILGGLALAAAGYFAVVGFVLVCGG